MLAFQDSCNPCTVHCIPSIDLQNMWTICRRIICISYILCNKYLDIHTHTHTRVRAHIVRNYRIYLLINLHQRATRLNAGTLVCSHATIGFAKMLCKHLCIYIYSKLHGPAVSKKHSTHSTQCNYNGGIIGNIYIASVRPGL